MCCEFMLLDRRLDILPGSLVIELGRVDSDHDQPFFSVQLFHLPDPGDRAHAVDSPKRPNVEKNHAAFERVPILRGPDPVARLC